MGTNLSWASDIDDDGLVGGMSSPWEAGHVKAMLYKRRNPSSIDLSRCRFRLKLAALRMAAFVHRGPCHYVTDDRPRCVGLQVRIRIAGQKEDVSLFKELLILILDDNQCC